MPILLFLIDTSASMNQRTHLGTTYLDIAKGAVETFMKVPALPGERRRERARGEGAAGGCGPGARGAAGETGGGTGGWAAPRRAGGVPAPPLASPSALSPRRSSEPGTRPAGETGTCWSLSRSLRTPSR